MARKLLKNGFLAIGLGCRSIKNFSDDVVLPVYLNSCFMEAIQSATLFCESTTLFFVKNNCRRGITLSRHLELSFVVKLIISHSNLSH